MNKIQFDGNLTRDPEIRHINGTKLATFTLASSYQKKDGTEETTFLDCTAWDKRAEEIQRITKGMRIEIGGRLKQDEWNDKKTGDKRTKLTCVVDHVTMPLWALWRSMDKETEQSQAQQKAPAQTQQQAPQAKAYSHPPMQDTTDYSGGYDDGETPF